MRRRQSVLGSVVSIERMYTPEHHALVKSGRPPFWYQHWLTSDIPSGPTPEEAGREFADLAIGEPLGSIMDSLVYDEHGLGWWGEPPLPPVRPER